MAHLLDKLAPIGQCVPMTGQLLDTEALADFLAVADAGSVSAGARQRGTPKQTVSRRLRSLESALGVRLFDRSTRALRLTEEGGQLQERARRILTDLAETRAALSARPDVPQGLVRLSAPVLLGQAVLGPLAANLVQRWPGIRLEIVLSDRRVDLIEEGFDAAIRVGPEDQTGLVSRQLAMAQTLVVAAPAVLARYGTPQEPEALAQLPCIQFGPDGRQRTWTLWQGRRQVEVAVTGPLGFSAISLCLDAAIAGGGFALVPAFIAEAPIASGTLVRVLPQWHGGMVPVRLVTPDRRLVPARLKVVADALADIFAAWPQTNPTAPH